MIARLLAAALVLAQAAPTPVPAARPLLPGGALHEALAGGQSALFTFEVPAGAAARLSVRQEGIDVGLLLRRAGSSQPEHGLDLVSGIAGEEVAVVPIADVAASWTLRVSASLPRGTGEYAVTFDLAPADDRARAVAAARARHHTASEDAWGGEATGFRAAQAGYAEAAEAARAAGDTALAAEAIYQGARIHDNLGDQPGAIEGQRRALALFRDLGRRDRQARVLNRLGDLSRKVGEVADAERFFQQALPIATDVGDPVNVADILNNSGLLMLSMGRYEEAVAQLEQAVPLAQEVNSGNVEGALAHNIGVAYRALGVYDKAVDWYLRSIEVKKRANLPVRRTASTLNGLAIAYFESGDRASAERAIREALALYEASGDRTGQADALADYGRLLSAGGDADGALALYTRAQPLLHEMQNRGSEAAVLTRWAALDIDRGQAAEALPRADEALRLARVVASPAAEQRALYVRALALQKLDRTGEALASIAAATESVETMRGLIQRSEWRTSYLATVRQYFDLHIDLLQRQGNVQAAFAMSERARARTLLEGLAESASKIHKGVDSRLLARLRAVQASLNAKESYRSQVMAASGERSPRALAIEREVARLLDEWNLLRATIRTASPAYWALHAPEPVTVERVQTALLDQDSALVEYHLGSARSYAWVIDKTSITVHELPWTAGAAEQARRYHELLSRERAAMAQAERAQLDGEVATLGKRLAAVVWSPIESRVRGKRLLIAADGVLQYVPFAALPASTGEPLVARHEMVYVPSASVLESIRQRSRPLTARAEAAVFADPVFSKNDPRLTAGRDSTASPRSRAADGELYGRLRFSRTEAEAITAVAPAAFRALDFSAAKQTLAARDLRNYRILHFATHGSLNTERPELSGLVLSLVDAQGKPVDGFLRLHEIYNLDLDADLVVLSACRTALGQEVHGEGLIGLTRGFMYAGASRVVSSVWNVDDRASARLMERFYRAMLTKGLTPASALREAQLSLVGEPRWANPHYWAAFGLQGDWK